MSHIYIRAHFGGLHIGAPSAGITHAKVIVKLPEAQMGPALPPGLRAALSGTACMAARTTSGSRTMVPGSGLVQ